MSLDARYQDVVRRVAGRARLVAVSKGQPVEAVRAVYDMGQRDFGENRADELATKAAALPRDVRWHFLGNLQRNKLRVLRDIKPLIHSFDRPELAPAMTGLDLLVQVHLGGGTHRNGLPPEGVAHVMDGLSRSDAAAQGLMLLPPPGEDPRPHFRALRGLRDKLAPSFPDLRELSMGMTDDFEIAIEEGATMVRVGRAIFGPRL